MDHSVRLAGHFASKQITLAAGELLQDVRLVDQFIVSATPTISTVPFSDDGSSDTITIADNGSNLEVMVNGNLWVRRPIAEFTFITANGSSDDDTIDASQIIFPVRILSLIHISEPTRPY